MIHLSDYVQNVDLVDRVSISHWGMFQITIPKFYQASYDYNRDIGLQKTIEQDMWSAASIMRKMKQFKESVAAFANKVM